MSDFISQCKEGNWCSHDGSDYLCPGCRPDTDIEALARRMSEALAPLVEFAEELEEMEYQFGMAAAARVSPPSGERA